VHPIDVDFEVLKALMAKRETEVVTYNDVLRNLLKLPAMNPQPAKQAPLATGDWVVKGTRFPAGSEFRSKHHGRLISARVDGGALLLNGEHFDSPSGAAFSITGYMVNGWRFWEVRIPGTETWRRMDTFRGEG
jgi:hypothetical protein